MKYALKVLALVAAISAGHVSYAQDVVPTQQDAATAKPPEIAPEELAYAFGVVSAGRSGRMFERLGLKQSLIAKAIEDVRAGGALAVDQQVIMASMMKMRSAFRDRNAPPVPLAEGEDPNPTTVTTDRDKDSYAGGVFLARQISEAAKEFKMDEAMVLAGMVDKLKGSPLKYDEQRIAVISEQLRNTMRGQGRQDRRERARMAEEEGKKFLEANAQKPDVKALPSGLQYKVLSEGSGATPKATDTVRAHYKSMRIDGTEFDTSYGGEPAEFPLDRVIPGWSEALQHMKIGSKWTVYLPANLAYGDRGVGSFGGRGNRGDREGQDIAPNSTLVFELELVDIVTKG